MAKKGLKMHIEDQNHLEKVEKMSIKVWKWVRVLRDMIWLSKTGNGRRWRIKVHLGARNQLKTGVVW